jgi:hypothetical protein
MVNETKARMVALLQAYVASLVVLTLTVLRSTSLPDSLLRFNLLAPPPLYVGSVDYYGMIIIIIVVG